MSSNQNGGNHLLSFAVSKLSPGIFSHPVWVRFSRKEKPLTHGTIDDLLSEAKKLQKDDPSSACQILLICAAYQNHAGQHNHALRTIQQALALAEYAGLVKETFWCAWGASATCFQEGYYEQTARYLAYLQDILSQQNEWVLADFVDIVRQSLPYPVKDSPVKQLEVLLDQPSDDLLILTLDWLQHWGFSPRPPERAFDPTSRHSLNHKAALANQSFLSVQRCKDWWHNFKLAVRSGLNLRQTGKIFPVLSGHEIDAKLVDKIPRIAGISVLSPAKPPNAVPKVKPASTDERISAEITSATTVVVQMLGTFSMTIQDLPLKLPASRGLSLLEYLLLHHKHDTPREVLMDVFWPDADPQAARNNLNVAMHSLRQALRSATDAAVIRFEDGAYGLAPDLEIWLDVEEFEHCVNEGQRLEARNQLTAAVTEYEIAVHLYRGDYLADNPYEGWTVLDRERLRVTYLDTLDHLSQIHFSQERYAACVTLCQLILSRDLCREDAHYRLMQCYSRLGQGTLAMRQYQICAEALRSELEVDPASETTRLYERIRHRENI